MGFALFDQSGTFNPLDYGLTVGDRLEVIVVGGGGGGGSINGAQAYGGNGGPSSFGGYLTALGGYGCSNTTSNTAVQWRATPTQYMTRGVCSNGYSNNNTPGLLNYGGGGGGGWWYSASRTDAIDFSYLYNLGNSSQYCQYIAPVDLVQLNSTGGRCGFGAGIYSNYTSYSSFEIRWPPADALWTPVIQNYSSTSCTGVFVPSIPVAGGCSALNHNSYLTTGQSYYTNQNGRGYYFGTGGLGYGAGGGSYCNNSRYRPGGCGGELGKASVVLQSLDAIPVSVGGGGSGGATYYNNSTWKAYNGTDGAAGAAGAAAHTYSCPGGYGTMIPAISNVVTSSSYQCYLGGGGAGGCVAIWW